MRYPHVLFDLDGTLIQSEEGILRSAKHALAFVGHPPLDTETLKKFIGPPLVESFERFCGLSSEAAHAAANEFNRYYSENGIFACAFYPGITLFLQHLVEAGISVHLATAKPEVFAERILSHFGVFPLFSSVVGTPLTNGHYRKTDVISRVLKEQTILPATAVMVGDRHHDIHAATDCRIDSIGVLYGYGSRQELTEAGATFLAENVAGLSNILC